MKRYIFVISAVFVLIGGCKRQHPSVITIDPDFDSATVMTVLIVPTISAITTGDDPTRQSEILVDRVFWEFINERNDYVFISPNTFRGAIGRHGLSTSIEKFRLDWMGSKVINDEFGEAIRSLNPDMVIILEVYLWNKDEADYRESATASATQVGMTLSMVDPGSGLIMWEATDENYREAIRTEGDRIQNTSGGFDRRIAGRSVSGKDVFAAPPFEDVVVLVVEALVNAIPEKVATGK
ncbi:MAG: hypothetical protein KAV42_04350 [Candidatus Krumholzibacteria bacterium]|nr:hypothetical protein [Candidatus Krumholzibacteria bacterium]